MSLDGNDPENTRVIHGTPYPTDSGDNAVNENAWSWGVLNRSGVALLGNDPIQGNTPFQFQDRTGFSPLPSNMFSQEGLFIGLLLFKLMKDKPQLFERLARRYMDNVTSIINHIADSGKAHPLSHLNSTTLAAAVAHRNGLLDNGGYVKVIDQTRSIIDKLINLATAGLALEGVQTLVEGTSTTQRVTRYGETTSQQGLAALANIRGATK